MLYLIDGHNLIGAIPDIHLHQADDEEILIRRMGTFCAAAGSTAEIYFDRAAPGLAGQRQHGSVRAVFVPTPRTADAAIRSRLGQLGRSARSCTVVSSDRQVQAEARSSGAAVIASAVFSALMSAPPRGQTAPEKNDPPLSEQDVAEWLEIFKNKAKKK